MDNNKIIWTGRKRFWCGLPTFTMYILDDDKLCIDSGFINLKSDEIRLYRILDISFKRTFLQRIFGLGTIEIISSDKTSGNFTLKNIKNSKEVRDNLSDLVEKARNKKKVAVREFSSENNEEDYAE